MTRWYIIKPPRVKCAMGSCASVLPERRYSEPGPGPERYIAPMHGKLVGHASASIVFSRGAQGIFVWYDGRCKEIIVDGFKTVEAVREVCLAKFADDLIDVTRPITLAIKMHEYGVWMDPQTITQLCQAVRCELIIHKIARSAR